MKSICLAIRVLEEARDRGRKYGITLMLMYQSVGQLNGILARMRDVMDRWMRLASYAAIKALRPRGTLRNVARDCRGRGQSCNVGWRFQQRVAALGKPQPATPWIMPHEITQMRKDGRSSSYSHDLIRCGRAIYSRERTWMRRPVRNCSSSPFSGRAVLSNGFCAGGANQSRNRL